MHITLSRALKMVIMATFVGYSGSDLQALCEEAAMMPIRELGSKILTVNANQVYLLICLLLLFAVFRSH